MLNIYKNKSFFNKIIAFVLLFIFSCAIFSQNSGIYFSSEKLKALLNTTPYMEMSTSGQEIKEKSDLDNINKTTSSLAGSYYLLGNLNLSKYRNITPTGTNSNPFTGEFNGNGFTITIGGINSTSEYVGLFGYIKNATIKNLTVILNGNINATNARYLGGICGYATNSTFENCIFVCEDNIYVKKTLASIGGICGAGDSSTFTNCINNSNIYLLDSENFSIVYSQSFGGIAGSGYKFENCINYKTLSGGIQGYMGGITGSATIVKNCYNFGKITVLKSNTHTYVGGVAGDCNEATDVYNVNDVVINVKTGNTCYLGGVIGNLGGLIDKASNSGNIIISNIDAENKHVYTHHVGGVVGCAMGRESMGNYSGTIATNLLNTGNITLSQPVNTELRLYYQVGGVIGAAMPGDQDAFYNLYNNCYLIDVGVGSTQSIDDLNKYVGTIIGYIGDCQSVNRIYSLNDLYFCQIEEHTMQGFQDISDSFSEDNNVYFIGKFYKPVYISPIGNFSNYRCNEVRDFITDAKVDIIFRKEKMDYNTIQNSLFNFTVRMDDTQMTLLEKGSSLGNVGKSYGGIKKILYNEEFSNDGSNNQDKLPYGVGQVLWDPTSYVDYISFGDFSPYNDLQDMYYYNMEDRELMWYIDEGNREFFSTGILRMQEKSDYSKDIIKYCEGVSHIIFDYLSNDVCAKVYFTAGDIIYTNGRLADSDDFQTSRHYEMDSYSNVTKDDYYNDDEYFYFKLVSFSLDDINEGRSGTYLTSTEASSTLTNFAKQLGWEKIGNDGYISLNKW